MIMENKTKLVRSFSLIGLEVLTVLGSLASIIGLRFYQNGEWVFENNIITWLFILCCVLLSCCLYIRLTDIVNNLSRNVEISGRAKFFEYVDRERSKVKTSIINIAGNLSWIAEEKESYKKFIEGNKKIQISMFYDESKIGDDPKKKEIIEEYRNMGVKIEPYPINDMPYLTSMMLDVENEDETRLYVFQKDKEQDDDFIITLYRKDAPTLKFAKAFIHSMKLYIETNKVIIGLSGINNIGKTTLSTCIKKELEDKVVIIEDTFNGFNTSDYKVAMECLLMQYMLFTEMLYNSKAKVILFDRTPIDNFVFLKMNIPSEDQNKIKMIKENVKKSMGLFSFVVYLKPSSKFRYRKTSHLTSNQRTKLRDNLDALYVDYPNKIEYNIDYLPNNAHMTNMQIISKDIIVKIREDAHI